MLIRPKQSAVLCVLVLFGCLSGLESPLRSDELKFVTGESIRGQMTGIDTQGLRFEPQNAAERLIPLRDIHQVKLGPSRPKGPLQVRYVRLDLPGKDKYLHVRELQVFVGDKNVAPAGQARQSSTFIWQDSATYPAERAIDQNLETTNHTADLWNPWLEVDLRASVTPTSVVVLNRTDQNLQSRLNGFRVLLFDEHWNLLWARVTPNATADQFEFKIPPTGEEIEPGDVATLESDVRRPPPWTLPLLSEPQDFVWFEDDVPDARPWENWNFNDKQPVFSGTRATTRIGTGVVQDVFDSAQYPLRVGEGDKFFVMAYLDPENPPKCLMLQWNDGLNWNHRAYWGQDVIPYGSGDNEGHRRIGDLPPVGKWVRLEVDATRVGCPAGSRISGWTCTQFDGKCYWDHGGIRTRTPQDEPRPRFFRGDDFEWKLRGGSVLSGTIEKWESGEFVLNTHLSYANPLRLPTTALLEAWTKPVATGKLSVNRLGEDLSQDNIYVQSSSGVQHVAGEIRGLSDGSLQLLHQGEVRKISREKIVGIVFKDIEPVALPEDICHVTIPGERVFAGHLIELTPRTLKLKTFQGNDLEFSRTIVQQFEFANGRIVRLADLKPTAVEETPYFDRHWNYQVNKSLMGDPLRIGTTTYSHGLAMHSRSVLTYHLAGQYSRLGSKLGLHEDTGDLGNATVRVLGDGRVLFEKLKLTDTGQPEQLDLDLSGVQELQLEVDFGENFDIGDHVIWCEPVLLRN